MISFVSRLSIPNRRNTKLLFLSFNGLRVRKLFLDGIDRMFPGYLSGERLICATPSDSAWHLAVGAHQGALLDCTWPTPGSAGTGAYSTLDCDTEIPT